MRRIRIKMKKMMSNKTKENLKGTAWSRNTIFRNYKKTNSTKLIAVILNSQNQFKTTISNLSPQIYLNSKINKITPQITFKVQESIQKNMRILVNKKHKYHNKNLA